MNDNISSFNQICSFWNITFSVVVEILETIDDDISKKTPNVAFVKIDNAAVAQEYGLPGDKPSLVFFEDGLPK